MSAITALTAQNTLGVTGISESSPEFFKAQLDAIFTDIYPDAVKIGMVASKELIETIADALITYKAKNIVLVIASLIFYSWGEPVWVCLLIFSSILDYTVSLGIEKYRGKKITKLFIALSVVINLGLLAAFKYSGFFISTLNGIFRLSLHVPAFSLPIGISFYTF